MATATITDVLHVADDSVDHERIGLEISLDGESKVKIQISLCVFEDQVDPYLGVFEVEPDAAGIRVLFSKERRETPFGGHEWHEVDHDGGP